MLCHCVIQCIVLYMCCASEFKSKLEIRIAMTNGQWATFLLNHEQSSVNEHSTQGDTQTPTLSIVSRMGKRTRTRALLSCRQRTDGRRDPHTTPLQRYRFQCHCRE